MLDGVADVLEARVVVVVVVVVVVLVVNGVCCAAREPSTAAAEAATEMNALRGSVLVGTGILKRD